MKCVCEQLGVFALPKDGGGEVWTESDDTLLNLAVWERRTLYNIHWKFNLIV